MLSISVSRRALRALSPSGAQFPAAAARVGLFRSGSGGVHCGLEAIEGFTRERRANVKNQPFHRRLRFALSGLITAFGAESSLRVQTVAAAAVLGVLLWSRPAPVWWGLVALTVTAVLATELLNTAVEHLADHLHPELHPSIKIVKDCAAAAVLLASLGAVAVAVALLIEIAS